MMAKSKFGYMACPDCGERVVVKVNERETLSYSCAECDGDGYRKKGQAAYAHWLKKITPAAPPPADPPKPGAGKKEKAPADPPPAPAAKPAPAPW